MGQPNPWTTLKGRYAVTNGCVCFLTIPVRPNISKSTRPIFATFAVLVELWLLMNSLQLVFLYLEDIATATNF